MLFVKVLVVLMLENKVIQQPVNSKRDHQPDNEQQPDSKHPFEIDKRFDLFNQRRNKVFLLADHFASIRNICTLFFAAYFHEFKVEAILGNNKFN